MLRQLNHASSSSSAAVVPALKLSELVESTAGESAMQPLSPVAGRHISHGLPGTSAASTGPVSNAAGSNGGGGFEDLSTVAVLPSASRRAAENKVSTRFILC